MVNTLIRYSQVCLGIIILFGTLNINCTDIEDSFSGTVGLERNTLFADEAIDGKEEKKEIVKIKKSSITKYVCGVNNYMYRNYKKIKTKKCTDCEFLAHTNGEVRRHYINKHTDELPFECEYCIYKNKIKQNLIRHVAAKHLICKLKKNHLTKKAALGCKNHH